MHTQQNTSTKNFIPLNNKKLAGYTLVFKVPPKYEITSLSQFSNKPQLYFVNIKANQLFTNLVFVDRQFYRLFSYTALLVFKNKLKNLKEYIIYKNVERILISKFANKPIEEISEIEFEYINYGI